MKKLTKGILYALCLFFLFSSSSCYSYHVFPKNSGIIKPIKEKKTVYIINPELKKEYSILNNAEIFNITKDSTIGLKIKLYPIKRRLACGFGSLFTLLSLGQLPVNYLDIYMIRFDEMENNKITSNEFTLNVIQRSWFWDMFVFNKNFNGKAGEALHREYNKK